jgi:hypothetical protein
VEEEQEEQEQDVYDNDDDDDDEEISCGSGVPSSAHGGHTRRDGDAVLLQLEVGVGGDVWGRKRRRSDEKIQMRLNWRRNLFCQIFFLIAKIYCPIFSLLCLPILSTHNTNLMVFVHIILDEIF